MDDAAALDSLFREAVSAVDAGDAPALERLLTAHPRLVRDRLDSAGAWLCDKVGDALVGFFEKPYLLWFVAEDPVRNGKLPKNIAEVARIIIHAAQREKVDSLREQLDYVLRLVCWSWIARECGVQIELMSVLIDVGASLDGATVYHGRFGTHCDCAIYNGNFAAAEYLLGRGASLTLSTALCLGRWADVRRLAGTATLEQRQDAFVLAALNGKADALREMLALGVHPTTVSAQNQSRAHRPASRGVVRLARCGQSPGRGRCRSGQARHYSRRNPARLGRICPAGAEAGVSRQQYAEIAAYLRERGAPA